MQGQNKDISQIKDYIENRIEYWKNSLLILQEKCPHTNQTHVEKHCTVSWSKEVIHKWEEHTCLVCGKMWRVS